MVRSAHVVRVAVALVATLGLAAASARSDELHLKNGKVLHGQLESQGRSSFKFLEVDGRRAKSIKVKTVERVVLTYGPPAFVFEDPQWSQHMLDARLLRDFDPEWGEMEILRSEHYIVFTNSSAGKRYLKTMEDLYSKFRTVFPFEEPEDAQLMPVFLFKTRDHYYEYSMRITGWSRATAAKTGGHAWRDYYATYYDAPGDSIHYHEGAHQLVHSRLHVNRGGSWFQEGMAVYFEGTVFTAEDPAKGIKSVIKSGRYTPLAELIELRSLLMSSSNNRDRSLGSRRYQQAGSTIKFLVEGPHGDKYPEFLEAVKSGRKMPEIFESVFGATIEELEQQWMEYYR